jgi:hypothetical protein
LLARTLGLTASDEVVPFGDYSEAAWYSKELSAAYAAGLVRGSGDNRFGPEDRLTREQLAVLLVRAYDYMQSQTEAAQTAESSLAAYDDASDVSSWAMSDVARAIDLGLMRGRGAGKFAPAEQVSRVEAAQAIFNLFEAIE